MANHEEDKYTISVGVRNALGEIKKVIGIGGTGVAYSRKLGQRNVESNEVTIAKGRKGIAVIMHNPDLHQVKFTNEHHQESQTFEAVEGFKRILPGDTVEITLKPRVHPTTNGDSELYVVFE